MDPGVGQSSAPGSGHLAMPAPAVQTAQRERVRARLFGAQKHSAELIAGRYRRLSLLGQGANGWVWEVEHVHTAGRFALKLLASAEATAVSANVRYLDARAASRVGHENIVQVTDAGQTEAGTPYVVMELLRGRTIAETLAEDGAMPWPRAKQILAQLANALGCAHDKQIVHRDLKAENVMLVSRGGNPDFCKIVDFGVAKMLDLQRSCPTRPGAQIGTPSTMSPEQIRGGDVDRRADIYALGCLAYQMLTAQRPFVGPDAATVYAQHLSSPPPGVGKIDGAADLLGRIDAFIAKAMAKRADQRFACMEEVRRALESIDAGPPDPPRSMMPARVPTAILIGGALASLLSTWWASPSPHGGVARAPEVATAEAVAGTVQPPASRAEAGRAAGDRPRADTPPFVPDAGAQDPRDTGRKGTAVPGAREVASPPPAAATAGAPAPDAGPTKTPRKAGGSPRHKPDPRFARVAVPKRTTPPAESPAAGTLASSPATTPVSPTTPREINRDNALIAPLPDPRRGRTPSP